MLDIDRGNKTLVVTSSKTHNKPVQTDWKNLFDKGKEKIQEEVTDKLSDKLFMKAIEDAMNRQGYTLVYSKC